MGSRRERNSGSFSNVDIRPTEVFSTCSQELQHSTVTGQNPSQFLFNNLGRKDGFRLAQTPRRKACLCHSERQMGQCRQLHWPAPSLCATLGKWRRANKIWLVWGEQHWSMGRVERGWAHGLACLGRGFMTFICNFIHFIKNV